MVPRVHRKPITEDDYRRLLLAYAQAPEDHTAASEACGVTYSAAKRAWAVGWPERSWRAISDVIAEDQQIARAKLTEEAEKMRREELGRAAKALALTSTDVALKRERAKLEEEAAVAQARQDAAMALVEEGRMIRIARNTAEGLFVTTQKLLAAMQVLVDQTCEEVAQKDQVTTPQATLKIVDRIGKIVRSTAEAAAKIMELERLRLGQPGQIAEIRTTEKKVPPSSPEEARQVIAECAEIARTKPVVDAYAWESEETDRAEAKKA